MEELERDDSKRRHSFCQIGIAHEVGHSYSYGYRVASGIWAKAKAGVRLASRTWSKAKAGAQLQVSIWDMGQGQSWGTVTVSIGDMEQGQSWGTVQFQSG